jgi:hypothetical protein
MQRNPSRCHWSAAVSASHQHVTAELDAGHIWARITMGGGSHRHRYWKLRRNGATKLWKRDLFRYRIPVKAGMYVYAEITNETEIGTFDSSAAFIYSSADPNTCPHRAAVLKGQAG